MHLIAASPENRFGFIRSHPTELEQYSEGQALFLQTPDKIKKMQREIALNS